MTIKYDILWRVYLTFAVVALLGTAVVVQSFRIQTVEGDHWRQMADSLLTAYLPIEAERGNIYTEDGSLLATSIPFYEVRMDVNSTALEPTLFYDKVDSLALCLSHAVGQHSHSAWKRKLMNARKRGERYLLIARNVTYPKLQQLKSCPIFRKGKYRGGFIAIQKNKRIQPFNMMAERTIGYVLHNDLYVGLEGYYDDQLAGSEGKRLMQRVSGGAWIPLHDGNAIDPEHGKDLVTTIDAYIQDVTQNALLRALKKHEAKHGTAVVMEVKTGKIKAIANLGPTASDSYWEIYNYAVGESTEPGSVFKLPSLIAVLEDGYAGIRDSVDVGDGTIEYYDRKMEDSESEHTGKITVQKAFEISSNVGISRLVFANYGDSPERFVERICDMGLDKKTGIDIHGEPEPLIKHPGNKNWSGTTLPWMSVGYEIKFTPLQMLTFYNAIANDGQMMQPYLVNEVREYGRAHKVFKPKVHHKQVCSMPVIDSVKKILEGVVEQGTAKNIRSEYYKIAGKTGTAKIAQDKYGYQKMYQSTFTGYFPADDPVYSCMVVITAPSKGGYYGSQVAAPVFREIADKLYANKLYIDRIQKEGTATGTFQRMTPYLKAGHADDIHTLLTYWDIPFLPYHPAAGMPEQVRPRWLESVPAVVDTTVSLKEREVVPGLVPNVQGMGLQDALYLLENSGLAVKIKGVGKGKVRRQSLRPGTRIEHAQTIVIELS